MGRWPDLFASQVRVVAGVMSGTSLDGIDAAVVRLEGSGRGLRFEMLGRHSRPFPKALASELRACAEADAYDLNALCRLGPRLAQEYAHAVREAVADSPSETVDLVGCHGQTIRHHPEPIEFAGSEVGGTLQLGSGAALSALLGVPVVSDFRSADVALGGQGAPLVPYVDYCLLGSDYEDRVALNLGGIANLTALPTEGEIIAFDTGPANMLIDAVCRRLFDQPFDVDGRIAASGNVIGGVLDWAMGNPYFDRPPPRSAGRRTEGDAGFGDAYADAFLTRCAGHRPEDVVATATALTVRSVADAVARFVSFTPARTIVSGGGARNPFLMSELEGALATVVTSDDLGVDSHFKEAIAFAVLAHEAVNGVPTGLPSVTGASRPAVLGAISWP